MSEKPKIPNPPPSSSVPPHFKRLYVVNHIAWAGKRPLVIQWQGMGEN